MATYETLLLESHGPVARVWMNRPRKANSINGPMWQELARVFADLDADQKVRCVVLGGQGRFFSAGIDLEFLLEVQQELAQLPKGRLQEALHRFIVGLQDSVNAIENCRKPVLAVIQGACIGGGLDIAAACDMRYATTSARFSVKEVDLAIVADLGSLQRLPAIVGEGIARELAYTGRTFNGQEALAMNLVNAIYDDADQLHAAAMRIAAELAAKSPLTMRGIKATMNYSRDHGVAQGLDFVALRNAAMLLSSDLEEAVNAFLEKRAPSFDD